MKKKILPDFVHEKEALELGFEMVIGVDEVGRGALAGPVVAGAVCLNDLVFSSRSPSLSPVHSAATASSRTAKKYLRRSDKFGDIDWEGLGIDDSKRLTAQKREFLAKIIKENCFWGIGEASVEEIEKLGIVGATHVANRRAIATVTKQVCHSEMTNQLCHPELTEPLRHPELTEPLRHPELDSGSIKIIEEIPKSRRTGSRIYAGRVRHDEDKKTFILCDAFKIPDIENIGFDKQLALIKGDQKSISIASASIIAKVYRDQLMIDLHQEFSDFGWKENKGYGTKKHLEAIKKWGICKHHRKGFV